MLSRASGICWKVSVISCPTRFRFFARSFGIRSARPFTATSVLKTENSLSLFPLTKRALLPALGFWPIIWPLPPHPPIMLFIRATILTSVSPFSVHLVTECRQLLAFILTWIRYFVQQAGRRVDLHSYSSFNGQSFEPANSNTQGQGKLILPLSSQWQTTWQ